MPISNPPTAPRPELNRVLSYPSKIPFLYRPGPIYRAPLQTVVWTKRPSLDYVLPQPENPPPKTPLLASGCGLLLKKIDSNNHVTEELSNPALSQPPGNKWEYERPSISPDGTKIVFSLKKGPTEKYDLYVKSYGDTNMNGPVNLTNSALWDEKQPSLSPDGTKVVYVENDGASDQIRIADIDLNASPPTLSNSVQLTWPANDIQPGNNTTPCVTKTGKILFVSDRDASDASHDIYMMDPDGSNVVNLTKNSADDIDVACGGTVDYIVVSPLPTGGAAPTAP
jgi:WD40 repeat protein